MVVKLARCQHPPGPNAKNPFDEADTAVKPRTDRRTTATQRDLEHGKAAGRGIVPGDIGVVVGENLDLRRAEPRVQTDPIAPVVKDHRAVPEIPV